MEVKMRVKVKVKEGGRLEKEWKRGGGRRDGSVV